MYFLRKAVWVFLFLTSSIVWLYFGYKNSSKIPALSVHGSDSGQHWANTSLPNSKVDQNDNRQWRNGKTKNSATMLRNSISREKQMEGSEPIFLGCRMVSSAGNLSEVNVLLRSLNTTTLNWEDCLTGCSERGFHLAAIKVSSKGCYCTNFTPGVPGVPCNGACKREGDCSQNQRFFLYRTSLSVTKVETACGVISLAEPGTYKPVALTSFPGSGNTWTRHLLEYATGLFTGSVYKAWNIYLAGYIGEFEDYTAGTTIVIKSHRFLKNCSGNILLIRNPFGAILAQFNLQLTGSQVKRIEGTRWPVDRWRNFTMRSIRQWSDLVFQCLLGGQRILVVHYENILHDVRTEIMRMVKFLTRAYPAEDRLQCTINWQEGLFHRKGTTKNTMDYYTQDLRDLFNRHITAVAMALKAYQKDVLPNSYSPPVGPGDKWPLVEWEMSQFAKNFIKDKQFVSWKNQYEYLKKAEFLN